MMTIQIHTKHARRVVSTTNISLYNMVEIAIVAIPMADMENGLDGTVANDDAPAIVL